MARQPLPTIAYSARDWDSIREAVFDYLKKKFPDDWTDFSESNLGVALVETVAYAFEVLSFSMDRSVNEVFMSTAQERQSIIKLAQLLGYKLSTATAASVSLRILPYVLQKLTSPVFISAGTVVPAGDLQFEIDKDYTLVKNTSTNLWVTNGGDPSPFATIGAVQGSTISESFTSDGTKFQTLRTSKGPYLDGSAYVTVAGVAWKEVDSLVVGDPVDATNQNIYETLLDKDDRLSIKFGDNITGNAPDEGATIQITQRTGGGSSGNVAARTISSEIPCTAGGIAAKVAVLNVASASGGTDRETIEHARAYAPAWGRTTDRAITYDDYIALCNGFSDGSNGRIAKAGVVAQPTDGLSNVVTIYTWGEDSTGNLVPISDPLKASLRSFLDSRKVITVYISPIQDGQNIPVDLDILVSSYPGFNKEDLKKQCLAVLGTLFRSSQVRYDNQLRMSWIHDYLLAVPGVKSISLRDPEPKTDNLLVAEIEPGTLPSQTGATSLQVIVTSPDIKPLNHYVNYNLVLGYNTTLTKVVRVIASTAVASPGGTCILTLDESPNSPAAGTAYTFRHPRKICFATGPASDPVNRRLVLRDPIGGVEDVERSIVDYDDTRRIATVNKNYLSNPEAGTVAYVTPDYYVNDLRAIVPGSIVLDVEDSF